MSQYTGEWAAVLTTVCWMVSALSFEASGKRIGSLPVNILRLLLGALFIEIYLIARQGVWFPVLPADSSPALLCLSGFIGFFLGDMLLFRSYVEIGSRVALLILSLVPPVTTFLEWLLTGQVLSGRGWISMAVTLTGVLMVLLKREKNGVVFKHPVRGILLAFGGTVGQSTGMVLSRMGIGGADPAQATLIRALAGLAGFIPLFIILGIWPRVFRGMKDTRAVSQLSLGALFGPFLGVTLSLFAMKHTSAGIVSIITALVPVVVIPPSILLFHEKVTLREIAGAVIAVGGVVILFL